MMHLSNFGFLARVASDEASHPCACPTTVRAPLDHLFFVPRERVAEKIRVGRSGTLLLGKLRRQVHTPSFGPLSQHLQKASSLASFVGPDVVCVMSVGVLNACMLIFSLRGASLAHALALCALSSPENSFVM